MAETIKQTSQLDATHWGDDNTKINENRAMPDNSSQEPGSIIALLTSLYGKLIGKNRD